MAKAPLPISSDGCCRRRKLSLISNVLAPSILNNKSCLQDSATVFTKNQVRAISGQNDEMCQDTNDVRYELLDGGRRLRATEAGRAPQSNHDAVWIYDRR